MVALLLLRYSPTGTVDRGTGDADVGLPIPIAAQGAAHLLLLEKDYVGESGNRYVKQVETAEKPTIDLLVPSFTGTHRTEVLGGRGFDAVAGLSAALTDNERMRVNATLLNGDELTFEVNVPTVSAAIALKAAAWAGRRAPKDETDLHNLFQIVEQNPGLVDRYRGELRATYLDAARSLHRLADSLEARPTGRGFNARFLASAIRTHISSQF